MNNKTGNSLYETGKSVCAQRVSDNYIYPISKSKVKTNRCPKKNYFKYNEEDYTFLSGTIRPPFNEREFNMAGVT